MFNKKNTGEPAEIKDIPDGYYTILSTLEGMVNYRGESSIDKEKTYPRLFIIKRCDPIFVSIKTEDIKDIGIIPNNLSRLDDLMIEKGKIVKISS
ncbi:hypothetical protein KKB43_05990 [Patescibacteria group bacterium]|nr:hypothetical protein [Patescibacteria group bacterium]MBU4580531.1 hypothetical protein [Patescibacteria group bacterium]